MSIHFNADEILEMAEQIERNGMKFYRLAAQREADAGGRDTLCELARMEEDHLRIFSDMRSHLSEDERKPTTFDPYDESKLYLRAMADRNVFNIAEDPTKRLTGRETIADVLHVGIQAEKDSIVFYLGLKEMVPARLGRERVEAIIKEEMSHIATLSAMLAEVG